jgi:hypothetical protein
VHIKWFKALSPPYQQEEHMIKARWGRQKKNENSLKNILLAGIFWFVMPTLTDLYNIPVFIINGI